MPLQASDWLVLRNVPQLHCELRAARGQDLSVGGEDGWQHGPRQWFRLFPTFPIPEGKAPVRTLDQGNLAVETQGNDGPGTFQSAAFLPRFRIPQGDDIPC